ncbi:MAG: hypothetical protein JWN18_618 [Parcubacteria group bacterium]|nr:hypothetical protein [Parcubacteria group bacterium]
MDKPKTTAKDFFFWAGAMVAFYWSVIAYTYLVFDYINFAFPNPLVPFYGSPYDSGISFEMASVIVLLPIYLLLMRFIHSDAKRDPSRNEIWVRRWAIIFTLFVAGVSIAIDIIVLLTTFLSGEALTIAFLLKVLIILLIAAGVFMHFIADLKGYWDTNPSRLNLVRIGVGALAVVTIVAGFFIVGTPQQARLERYDSQKVADLQNIDRQVKYYWQAKQKLPSTLEALRSAPAYGQDTFTDPQTGVSYEYEPTGPMAFTLCAQFNAQSRGTLPSYSEPMPPTTVDGRAETQKSWNHGTGHVCFDSVVDPAFYPPLTK